MSSEDKAQALQEALRSELENLLRRAEAIKVLLGQDGDLPSLVPAPSEDGHAPAGRRGPGVSEAKLAAVRDYMEAHPRARQVDIARDLGENTGSVSLALRWLASLGDVRDTGEIDNKAKVWEFTGEPAARPQRTTKIEPGVGVSEGRRA